MRGRLRTQVPLAPRTWLRVGGPADAIFQPADLDDLIAFPGQAARGAGDPDRGASNILVRDGGIDGVVVKLAGPLAEVQIDGDRLVVGAGVTDRMIAITAQKAGLAGLEFYIGIPGPWVALCA